MGYFVIVEVHGLFEGLKLFSCYLAFSKLLFQDFQRIFFDPLPGSKEDYKDYFNSDPPYKALAYYYTL